MPGIVHTDVHVYLYCCTRYACMHILCCNYLVSGIVLLYRIFDRVVSWLNFPATYMVMTEVGWRTSNI